MEFRILGPLEVWRDDEQVRIAPRERGVLAVLLLHANAVVPRDELIDQLWGDEPPATAKASLQNAISGLRRSLGDGLLETVPQGYRLRVRADDLDVLRFERLVTEARGAEPPVRSARLREALAHWRGPPFSDYPFAEPEIVRLQELRLVALEQRIDADLELGLHEELVPELEALVIANPLRERLWAQLLLALYRAGRPADALAAYRRAHNAFVDELGIEPGATLRELQRAILVQDRALFELHRGPDLIERAAVFLPTDEAGRAQTLYDYALALWRTGERARARSALLECERRAEAIGNRPLAHRARVLRAHHAVQSGEITLREFERTAAHAVEAVRADDDPASLADVLLAHGIALRDGGHADRAVLCHEEGLRLALELGDRWREGLSRSLLGMALMLGQTRVEDALEQCERHLAALEWAPPGPVGLRIALGMLHTQAGRPETGRRHFSEAAAELRAVGAASTLSTVEFFGAWATAVTGDYALAASRLRDALELIESLGDEGSRATLAVWLARLEALTGRLDAAEELVTAVAVLPQAEEPLVQLGAKRALGIVARARGKKRRANDLLREAVALSATTDYLTLHGETLEDAGELAAALSAFERKGDVLGAARVRQRDQPSV